MKVSDTTFEGEAAVELVTDALRLVAVTARGPRVAFLGRPGGENLLLWKPGEYTRGDWDLSGGHRVWVTRPGADECDETYSPDNGPVELAVGGDGVGFTLTGAEDPFNRTCRGFSVRALSPERLEVDNFVTNTGEMLYSGGVWGLTCTVPGEGTRYGIPLGDGGEWDCFSMLMFRRWAGHDGGYADGQIAIGDDMLIVDPAGRENKRMLQAQRGVIAMSDPSRSLTFAKKVSYARGAQYPQGCNMAFYVGPSNFMVEMETMGSEVTLTPGETAHNVETWALAEGADALDDVGRLVGLFE